MNLEKQSFFNLGKPLSKLSNNHLLNKESYDTNRNKIKGYKDVL